MNNKQSYNVFPFLKGFDIVFDGELREELKYELMENDFTHVRKNHFFFIPNKELNLEEMISYLGNRLKEIFEKFSFDLVYDENIQMLEEKQSFYIHLFNEMDEDEEPEYYCAGVENKDILDDNDSIEYTCERLVHYLYEVKNLSFAEEKVIELGDFDYSEEDEKPFSLSTISESAEDIFNNYFKDDEFYNFIHIEDEDEFYKL